MKYPKHSATKNIKVNVYVTDLNDKTTKTRTSTTLNYDMCDLYFGECLYFDEGRKAFKKSMENYRKWLITKAQDWLNEQTIYSPRRIDQMLLKAIYEHAYKQGLDKNKDNLGLDL